MMETDILTIATQVASLVTTVIAAAWWLSQRLNRLSATLDSHTQVVNQRMQTLEREICGLKRSVDSQRDEIHGLRERAVRLEAKAEGT